MDYHDLTAARFLVNGEEKAITFFEYQEMTFSYVGLLRGVIGEAKKEQFVAIQLDTCPKRNAVFFGVIAAGYNAVLIDFNLSDEMTSYILSEAGAAS